MNTFVGDFLALWLIRLSYAAQYPEGENPTVPDGGLGDATANRRVLLLSAMAVVVGGSLPVTPCSIADGTFPWWLRRSG